MLTWLRYLFPPGVDASGFLEISDGFLNVHQISEIYPSPNEGRIDPLTAEWIAPPCLVVYTSGSGDEPARVICGDDAQRLLSILRSSWRRHA